MAEKASQSVRIAAEAANTPPYSAVSGRAVGVVERYRLQPADLPSGLWEGRVHSITTQGVEALTTLAFVEGLAKPLALHDDDVQTLVRLTDSPFAGDWIGCKVVVRAVRCDGERVLRLYAPGAAAPPVDVLAPPRPRRRKHTWSVLVFLLALVALSVWLIYAVEQRTLLWTLIEQTVMTPAPP